MFHLSFSPSQEGNIRDTAAGDTQHDFFLNKHPTSYLQNQSVTGSHSPMQYSKQITPYQQTRGTNLSQNFFDELQTLSTSSSTNLKHKELILDL